MAKKILWIFNDARQREMEVPLLVRHGFEVLCPKSYNLGFGDNHVSVSFEYDQTLTLPEAVLDRLNGCDFYNGIGPEVMALLNEYFDAVFCPPIRGTLRDLALAYKGALVLRVVDREEGLATTTRLRRLNDWHQFGDWGILTMLDAMGDRFWYAPGLKSLTKGESALLTRRMIFLPLGLADAAPLDTWRGTEKRLLYICENIRTDEAAQRRYRRFKAVFKKVPHAIVGGQLQPVDDDASVLETGIHYEPAVDACAALYRDLDDSRFDYDLLEAIRRGIPVVFTLEHPKEDDRARFPGFARSPEEARQMIRHVLDGDETLIGEIRESQMRLLEPHAPAACEPLWAQGLTRLEAGMGRRHREKKRRRIGVILPAPYTGGVLDYALRFVTVLKDEIDRHGDDADILFAHPRHKAYEERDYFAPLRERKIPVRPFVEEEQDGEWVDKVTTLAGLRAEHDKPWYPEKCTVLKDELTDFGDCDYLILMDDAVPGGDGSALFAMRPYAVVAQDYVQRYCPEAVPQVTADQKALVQARADRVLVTSEPAMSDAVQYGGLPGSKVVLTPPLLDVMAKGEDPQDGAGEEGDYFLWITDAAPHGNHMRALRGLLAYYERGGSLDCVIAGEGTKSFDPDTQPALHFSFKRIKESRNPQKRADKDDPSVKDSSRPDLEKERWAYVEGIRKWIESEPLLKKHLRIRGGLKPAACANVLAGARFAFHPGYGDNGATVAVDAAGLGVPTLSSEYPAMRALANFMEIPLRSMPAFAPDDIAEALLDMEANAAACAAGLPSRDQMLKHTYRAQGPALYEALKREQIL